MLNTILGYILAFIIALTISGLVTLITFFTPLGYLSVASAGVKSKTMSWTVSMLLGSVSGFVTVWFSLLVFSWLDIFPTIALPIILILSLTLFDMQRIRRTAPITKRYPQRLAEKLFSPQQKSFEEQMWEDEIFTAIGDFLGVTIGAIFLLP